MMHRESAYDLVSPPALRGMTPPEATRPLVQTKGPILLCPWGARSPAIRHMAYQLPGGLPASRSWSTRLTISSVSPSGSIGSVSMLLRCSDIAVANSASSLSCG